MGDHTVALHQDDEVQDKDEIRAHATPGLLSVPLVRHVGAEAAGQLRVLRPATEGQTGQVFEGIVEWLCQIVRAERFGGRTYPREKLFGGEHHDRHQLVIGEGERELRLIQLNRRRHGERVAPSGARKGREMLKIEFRLAGFDLLIGAKGQAHRGGDLRLAEAAMGPNGPEGRGKRAATGIALVEDDRHFTAKLARSDVVANQEVYLITARPASRPRLSFTKNTSPFLTTSSALSLIFIHAEICVLLRIFLHILRF